MTEEFKRLKEALKKAATPEAMKEAAQRFREYQEAKKKRGSRPTIVFLPFWKTRRSVEYEEIPDLLEKDPSFFEEMREITSEED